MRSKYLREVVRRKVAGASSHCYCLLAAHHKGIHAPACEHEAREDKIHNADFLCVERGEPLAPQPLPTSSYREKNNDAQPPHNYRELTKGLYWSVYES